MRKFVYGYGATPDLAVADARRRWDEPPPPYKNQAKRIAAGTDLLKELGL